MTAPLSSSLSSSSSPQTILQNGRFHNLQSEFVAVVLAATVGTRLFPLTNSTRPKHLLPVAGVPILQRLLHQIEHSGFGECVVAIAQDDSQTLDFFQQLVVVRQDNNKDTKNEGNSAGKHWRELSPAEAKQRSWTALASLDAASSKPAPSATAGTDQPNAAPDFSAASVCLHLESSTKRLVVTVVRLGEDCEGSVGALNQLESTSVLAPKSHICVMPGDLVLLDNNNNESNATKSTGSSSAILMDLVHTHRQGQSSSAQAACTVLLSDVGEQDENGVPLKESAKQKKGGLARDEDDIEYMALSYPRVPVSAAATTAPRVVWKQSKLEAEEDKDMTGATPKLQMPKPRLRAGEITKIRTDWSDCHVYVLSPWVRRLLQVRNAPDEQQQQHAEPPQPSLISLADDVLPLLISRQFLSIQETFGSKMEAAHVDELLKSLSLYSSSSTQRTLVHSSSSSLHAATLETSSPQKGGGDTATVSTESSSKMNKTPYSVLAHVQKSAYRSATVPAYLFVSKEMVVSAAALQQAGGSAASDRLLLPPGSNLRGKFQTIVLPDSKIGDKVTFKSTIVGRNCTLGHKCRLNNVILHDSVTLGDQVSLQNTVVGRGATLGNNCSLNDCQVEPKKHVPAGTKAKNEALTLEDDEDGDAEHHSDAMEG